MNWLLIVVALGYLPWTNAAEDLSQWVNPLIGTVGAYPKSTVAGGHVFPGAAVPFGVVKIGIDTSGARLVPFDAINGGYSPLGNFTAISLMHESGTGGEPKYGVVAQTPLVGDLKAQGINVGNNWTYLIPRVSDTARAGHWTSTLKNGITLELTATAHTGFARYTYPKSGDRHVLVDLAHVLSTGDDDSLGQQFVSGSISVNNDSSAAPSPTKPSYTGYAEYNGGFNRGPTWRIYFCGTFSQAFDQSKSGIFKYPYDPYQSSAVPPTTIMPLNQSHQVSAPPNSNIAVGGLFTWTSGGIIESRIGISFISAEKACDFIADESPVDQTFDQTVENAKALWNENVLGSVTIPDDGNRNETMLRMLYTGLYYTGLMPSNRTGENPGWNTTEPSYDDFYTLWDIFRCLTPWYHLVQSTTYVEMIRSIIDIFLHDGWTPDGRSSNANGLTQGGSNVDNVLGDAFVKGLDTYPSINWTLGWEAMVNDAEVIPPDTDSLTFDGRNKEGRGALDDWIKIGWLTRNHTRCISRTVEYAQNDFALYQIAKRTNRMADAQKYLKRAKQWENLWNPNMVSNLSVGDFSGFLTPRDADGSWNLAGIAGTKTFNVTDCGDCEWDADTYEATAWEYSMNVPHDVANLIGKMGGPSGFTKRLDTMFIQGLSSGGGSANTAGTSLFNAGNEPDFLTPFLYNYVPGYQWSSVNQSRNVIDRYYNDQENGIPGNSDAGAMQSWMIWNFVGLYPVTGQPLYLLHAPRFEALDIRLLTPQLQDPNAQPAILQIRAPGYSETNFWPQSIKLNNQTLDRVYVWHSEIENGATLEWEMGSAPSQWDKDFSPPPSLSTGGL